MLKLKKRVRNSLRKHGILSISSAQFVFRSFFFVNFIGGKKETKLKIDGVESLCFHLFHATSWPFTDRFHRHFVPLSETTPSMYDLSISNSFASLVQFGQICRLLFVCPTRQQ